MAIETSVDGRSSGARLYWPELQRWWAVSNDPDHYADRADEDLVNLLRRRDVRALETLYRRHGRAVYSLSLKMLGEGATAEEVVQECFLKLWRQPERYQPERGKLLSWLLGVTHHRAVDQLRRRRLEQRHTVNGEIDPGAAGLGDPEQHAWGHFQVEAIGRALADLPPNQRLVLELGYLRGMTQTEIAAYLGEPLGTIKTRTRLAMQKLRAMPELVALTTDESL
jgi:RNA polymerase sigma-70 factor (ECF subfamily)